MNTPAPISEYALDAVLSVRKKGDKVSLTDLWKLVGSPDKKAPSDWQNRESTGELIDALCEILNTPKMGVLESKRGRRDGGTWAHKNLALSYAKWLDPKLHIRVNEAFFQTVEEEVNPELAVERGNARAARTWTKQGKDNQWISQRIISISARKAFTGTLKSHGVERDGYRNCTNAVYSGIFGGTSAVVRQKLDLDKSDSIRDNMSLLQLSATQLAEALAMDEIEQNNLRGNANCEQACTKASRVVAGAIMQNRRR